MSSPFLDFGRGLISAAESMMASVSESVGRLGAAASWAELAADAAAVPVSGMAAFTATLGTEAFRTAAATRPGQAALDAVLASAGGADDGARRESLVAVASDSGAAVIRGGFALAETALRLAFGDRRRLRQALAEGLEQMRLLADGGEMHDLLPVPAVDEQLRERARRVVDRTPRRFIAALGETPEPSRLGEILGALLDDAGNLRVFVVAYPRVALLVVSRVGRLLAAGELDVRDVEAFLEGRRLAGL